MSLEKVTYGIPGMTFCAHCHEFTYHKLKQYSIVVENSFMPGYKNIRLDMSMVCSECGTVHPVYDSYQLNVEEDSVEDFEKKIEENRRS